jgi:hypothetical protein
MTILYLDTQPDTAMRHPGVRQYLLAYSRSNAIHTRERLAGHWLIHKAHRQAAELGTYRAALNLRKQGVRLELALAILSGRP